MCCTCVAHIGENKGDACENFYLGNNSINMKYNKRKIYLKHRKIIYGSLRTHKYYSIIILNLNYKIIQNKVTKQRPSKRNHH